LPDKTSNASIAFCTEACVTSHNYDRQAFPHRVQYGEFRQLFEQGYLDKRFNSDQPHERGYVFMITLVPKSEGKVATYKLNANPEQSEGLGATGRNFYYLDPESGICFSKVGPATAADDTL